MWSAGCGIVAAGALKTEARGRAERRDGLGRGLLHLRQFLTLEVVERGALLRPSAERWVAAIASRGGLGSLSTLLPSQIAHLPVLSPPLYVNHFTVFFLVSFYFDHFVYSSQLWPLSVLITSNWVNVNDVCHLSRKPCTKTQGLSAH